MEDPKSLERIRELFDRAIRLPAEQRASFVERESGADEAMRATVAALVSAHERAGDFLGNPDVTAGELGGTGRLAPGARIGRYTIIDLLGEGGYGTVYRAEQDAPLRRTVALKVIKAGMDTRQVVARFELEREALARMDHPNIARVLDAGATESGRPYFVMELVEGKPITDFCRENRLGLDERLALFVTVCTAVQHAHQKGILHRDLKPGNVLVVTKDGAAVPKVIDFGIAKALDADGRGSGAAAMTREIHFLGTPQYISPEQAQSPPGPLDPRTDVYSLGALLYELLTNQPPFDPSQLREAGYAAIGRVLRETDPPAPSTRLAQRERSAMSFGTGPGAPPRRLARQIRGDLDRIAMKAMEKDASRRYDSAAGLGDDIARYLDGRPVLARPATTAYRLQRFVRRNRKPLTAGAIAILALVGGLFAGWLVWRHGAGGAGNPLASLPLEPGLSAEIFSGSRFEQRVASRTDRLIDFSWARGVPPAPGVSLPHYSIRWSGVLVVPAAGATTIGVDADDGARLLIDGGEVLSFARPRKQVSHEGLSPGRHLIQLDYSNRFAEGHVTLLWVLRDDTAAERVVPADALFHFAQDPAK